MKNKTKTISFNGHASNCDCVSCQASRAIYLRKKTKNKTQLKPWALGFNGHARNCDCNPCVKIKVAEFKRYYSESFKQVSMPSSEKTVFVRPHWRKHKNHPKQMPHFRKALIKAFL